MDKAHFNSKKGYFLKSIWSTDPHWDMRQTTKKYSSKVPTAYQAGKLMRSRYVMARSLGRNLTSKEVVHHIDEDKTNDNMENLMLFPTSGAHSQYHHDAKGHTRGGARYIPAWEKHGFYSKLEYQRTKHIRGAKRGDEIDKTASNWYLWRACTGCGVERWILEGSVCKGVKLCRSCAR